MNFKQALDAMYAGNKITRVIWDKDIWIRRIDLYSDKEFTIREYGSAIGKWIPFFIIINKDIISPYKFTENDVQAKDFVIFD